MRPTTLLCSLLLLAFAGVALAPNAQAQRLSQEAAEAEGLDLGAPAELAPAAPAEGGGLQVCADDVLLIVDSTNDGVDIHDPATGDLVIDNFILDPTNLSTPKNAIGNFDGTGIFVIDQITDGVYEYDCNGNFIGLFAPAGGVNTAILDNAIAIDYSPDGTELWAAVTGGANADAIARFDQSGNYLGNIVANGAGGLDGPFDVYVRDSDILVPAITSDNVHQYDLTGTFLGVWQSNTVSFPEQMNEADNGNVLLAEFSGSAGAYEYDATGNLLASYSSVTGSRGIYELPNGNLLITSGSSVKEITRSDVLVRDFGSGNQYIELFEAPAAGCDLSLNSVSVSPDPVAPGGTVSIVVNGTNAGAAQTASLMLVYTGPITGMINLGSATFPGDITVTRTFRVRVPSNAPQGTYTLTFNLKDGNGGICDSETSSIVVGGTRVGQTGGVAFELVEGNLAVSASAVAAAEVGVSPNPFQGQTTLRYAVSEATDVRLAVYDVLGREVAVLVEGRMEAGSHAATFDARGLAAGVYVYRLTAGAEVQTGRITLTR